MKIDLNRELRRTAPDTVVFNPGTLDRSTGITGNEHFLVERISPDRLIAVWTQSGYEGESNQQIVFSRSLDDGQTWSAAKVIAEADPERGVGMASWGFPAVSRSGRIYVFFSRHTGVNDFHTHTAGRLSVIQSDDAGDTWSEPVFLEMPRSIYDHADVNVPPNVIFWQKPLRLSHGRHFAGFTRWSTRSKELESLVEFARFENIDDDPNPVDVKITFFHADENALRLGARLQEPSIVALPDGRLFCAMRTDLGYPAWCVSADQGEIWSPPQPLRPHDDAEPFSHPLSPCPIYELAPGKFAFFYHNRPGSDLEGMRQRPYSAEFRRPICVVLGVFDPHADQPITFSNPWYWMDNGGVNLLRTDFALYASATSTPKGLRLWYPDRKFFLLGRQLNLADLEALPGIKFKTG